MDEIEPNVKIDDPSVDPSRQYILSIANTPDFDYPQVSTIFLLKIIRLGLSSRPFRSFLVFCRVSRVFLSRDVLFRVLS